CAREVFAYW
nr:immunoglobulin heavy chain junction region [Mus musculus]